MDEVFRLLADNRPSRAIMNRAFEKDERRQRSFLFNFEYFTLIGDDCKPMKWQQSDDQLRGSSKTHLPITRCSSVTALSLSGPPISSVKSRERKSKGAIGHVFDPFAPWRLLSVQCYPDWKSSLDSHDSTKHYVNGPEAFMVTLRAEFRDAQKRMLEIYRRINTLVSMPAEYLFKEASRDKLLFEDANFTYSRRYFWAYQTLGVLNDNIQAICSSYKNTFTDDVWNGRNKIIWPGTADQSSRHAHWRKKMNGLRKDMEYEIDRLEEIIDLNIQKQKDIDRLREYVGAYLPRDDCPPLLTCPFSSSAGHPFWKVVNPWTKL
ncbi:MAG: hypothetical protein M1834_007558 [Cirrosporium novae-zelandiae]|nr:MAG: hypothetical protein M1834_007558 [Cirrosporium novae-zelandiae]